MLSLGSLQCYKKPATVIKSRKAKQVTNFRKVVSQGVKYRTRSVSDVRVTATAQVQPPPEKVEFMTELRQYAMKLHTKEQAPKEGKSEKKSTPVQQWNPSLQGYFNFLVQSKIVYDTFEKIFAQTSDPVLSQFSNNGMERGPALENDIAWYKNQFEIVQNDDEVLIGSEYADFVADLAKNSPPAFICHFYNHYFAHTAGGLMIGRKISKDILDGKTLEFYQYGIIIFGVVVFQYFSLGSGLKVLKEQISER
eukprot:TRINITY_DN1675_c1_g1_i17.p1 TRINITY_DN1675_c1_g1~~TRINITY_DN1675_c1_g1_i17.p1  ORF type:complete len:251 (+),score=33.29 TRINITY_DN1675_c1_g1_i17:85-837(+)